MTAVAADEFAAAMARFEPFERAPHVAAAVSGGADSLALAFLLAGWAKERGGRVTAVTVDHRLRPDSTAEAARLGAVLERHGVPHRILTAMDAAPDGNIEAAARALRYRLLEAWCRAHAVLHLATAHHRDDQAETLLLRLARGSGLDGLAAMARVRERADCRILRPLLDIPRARLAATVAALGETAAEDPMNRDPAFARVRLRRAADVLAAEGLGADRLAATAANLGRARAALEADVASLLARTATLHPSGYGLLDLRPLAAAPDEVALRALAAVLASLGGAAYPPRFERSRALFGELRAGLGAARTLGGCVLAPWAGRVLVCREAAAAAPPVAAPPGARVAWDGRVVLVLPDDAPPGLRLGALGRERGPWSAALAAVPGPARPTLPALFDGNGVAAVPALSYARPGMCAVTLRFRPLRALTGAGFAPAP